MNFETPQLRKKLTFLEEKKRSTSKARQTLKGPQTKLGLPKPSSTILKQILMVTT
jgi:hypothetical protein